MQEGLFVQPLDLYSIRHTKGKKMTELRCDNNAPHIFFIGNKGTGVILQGCCNSWTCSRCGRIRANEEYYKMTYGARVLETEGHGLYFVTLTCRGRDISLQQAEKEYYKMTSKFLNSMRMKCRRADEYWCYVQVTERQKRGHPHSHLIMTYIPDDKTPTKDSEGKAVLISKWLTRAVERSGLGNQHVITPIRSASAVAIYIAKYLYKDAVSTKWPRKWRRVRYSRNWPRDDEQAEKPEVAFPLLTPYDWHRVRTSGVKVETSSEIVAIEARQRGVETRHVTDKSRGRTLFEED